MYWVTGILGVALGVAPFVFNYSHDPFALWASIILGAIMLLASAYESIDTKKAKWEYWVAGVAGLLAVVAPFVFGFTALTMAMWVSIVLGAIVLILSGYEVFFVQPAAS